MNRRLLAAILWLTLVSAGLAQGPIAFTKVNRDQVVCAILQEVARATGGKTGMSDSGSGKLTSDMDVTGKLCVKRPDGTINNDLTPEFFAAAKKLYGGSSDFTIDKHGALRSKKLDTAVHDARNAVPDFRCALPLQEFKVKYMAALTAKKLNPDAYFTAGGNQKQVTARMQTKSRLRVFDPKGGMEETVIDREKNPAGYDRAMKKNFDMNPEDVVARKHGRELFGDSFDGFRQSTLHAGDPQHINDDPKYNTRLINNLLQKQGYPPNWSELSGDQKNQALQRLFPSAEHAAGREKMIQVLDDSFAIYTVRDMQGGSFVGPQSDFHAFSEQFQRAAIADMAEQRLPDLLNPNVTLQDVKDHAQVLAQKDGKSWNELSNRERLTLLQKAREQKPELTEKLKFAAAGELAMVFKCLDGMDNARADRLKQQIMDKVPDEQKAHVKAQLDMVSAYMSDPSNRKANCRTALKNQRLKLDPKTLAQAAQMRREGTGLLELLGTQSSTVQGYLNLRNKWAEVMARFDTDPTSARMAGTLQKLDKTQSMLNLIRVYQESNGDPEAMKRAVYMEVASRNVPGYDSYQLYKMWSSGNPQAQEEVEKSLVFQGLTMLPGGAVARGFKLAVDTARTGLDITIGYGLNQEMQKKVDLYLQGGPTTESILAQKTLGWEVPGETIAEKRQNLYKAWKGNLGLERAFRLLNEQKRIWDRYYPDQKAEPSKQSRYRRTVDAFYEKTRQQIAKRVDGYLGDAAAVALTQNAEAREALINVLFADFVNGLNRELGQSLLRDAERQAEEEQSKLDAVGDYVFGCFSEAVDKALNLLAGDEPKSVPGRFTMRFDVARLEKDPSTGEQNVTCSVQVVPPLRPTFEERNTSYVLEVSQGDELAAQIINGRVKFRLRHPKTRVVVAEEDFEFEKAETPEWLTQLQKCNNASVGFTACVGNNDLDTSRCPINSVPITWAGVSFRGTSSVGDCEDAVEGSIDVKTKKVAVLKASRKCSGAYYVGNGVQAPYSSATDLGLADVPLEWQERGIFSFAAEGAGATRGVVTAYHHVTHAKEVTTFSLGDIGWSCATPSVHVQFRTLVPAASKQK